MGPRTKTSAINSIKIDVNGERRPALMCRRCASRLMTRIESDAEDKFSDGLIPAIRQRIRVRIEWGR